MSPGEGRGGPCRVLVVSASMGAGHTHAARELAARLAARGHLTREIDALALPPHGQGRALRRFYFAMLRWAPALYDGVMRAWARWPAVFERITAAGAGGYERALLAEIEEWRPDVVVATFDLVAQALGRLRARGEIDTPLVTYVTDPGAHPYWVSAHVDRHLAVTSETARELTDLGAPGVAAPGPLVGAEFRADQDRAAARARWELPPDATVALVAAGSWAVGSIESVVDDLLDGHPGPGGRAGKQPGPGGILPVVLCGHNKELLRRLAPREDCRGVGWTDDVAGLMAASDVLVDNAGGLTCLQALASGLPVVSYRPIPGHGRFNADTLARAGLVHRASDAVELRAAVRRLAQPGPARDAVTRLGKGICVGDPADEVLAAIGGRL